jgi:hypothetical protein
MAPPKEFFPRIGLELYPGLRANISGGLKSSAGRAALYAIEFYTTGLIIQWRRIVETMDESFRAIEKDEDEPAQISALLKPIREMEEMRRRDLVQLDLHFFLICWDKLDKCWSVLDRGEANPAISKIYGQLKVGLHAAGRARDYLEHPDRRYEQSGWGASGHGIGSDGSLKFTYQDKSNKGKAIDRQVDLGKAQVERARDAYKSILRLLGGGVLP